MRNCCWLPALWLLAACGAPDGSARPAAARKSTYFDVKGFLDAQVAELNRQQPAVEKRVQLRDGQVETTRVAKTDWAKELAVFYQADINKPALRGLYTETTAGTGRRYRRHTEADAAPVTELVVEGTGLAPQSFTALVKQDNPLFYSEKKLRLRLRNGYLVEYEVQGVQKLVLFDTVRYSVRARTANKN